MRIRNRRIDRSQGFGSEAARCWGWVGLFGGMKQRTGIIENYECGNSKPELGKMLSGELPTGSNVDTEPKREGANLRFSNIPKNWSMFEM